jgi:hypothetical protein
MGWVPPPTTHYIKELFINYNAKVRCKVSVENDLDQFLDFFDFELI